MPALSTVFKWAIVSWVFVTSFCIFQLDFQLSTAPNTLAAGVTARATGMRVNAPYDDENDNSVNSGPRALRVPGNGPGDSNQRAPVTTVTRVLWNFETDAPALPSFRHSFLPSHIPLMTSRTFSRSGSNDGASIRIQRAARYSFYEQQASYVDGGQGSLFTPDNSYQCQRTGRVEFQSAPSAPTAEGAITYGQWSMKWPRFIRQQHLVWWRFYDVSTWREQTGCPLEVHPWSTMPQGIFDRLLKQRIQEGAAFPELPEHAGSFTFCEPEMTSGRVQIALDATVAASTGRADVCDSTSSVNSILANAQAALKAGVAPLQRQPKTLFWADVEAGSFYQHWVQNIFPKLAQAAHAFPDLLSPDQPDFEGLNGIGNGPSQTEYEGTPLRTQLARVVAKQHLELERFPVIRKFYDHIGWDVIDGASTPITAQQVVYSCATPPMHPYLWQAAQQRVFGVVPKPLAHRRSIVYAGRTRGGATENEGRRVLNEDLVLQLLGLWAPAYNVVQFDHRTLNTIDDTIGFWSDARVILGPHGGALTGLTFAACDTTVIELMPLVNGYHPPLRHAGMMFYTQASMLEQDYWLLPITTELSVGDFHVPLDQLCEVLMATLGHPDGSLGSAKACRDLTEQLMRKSMKQ